MYKYLILGNSVAAIAAAEAIRERDREGNLLFVSPEKFPAYSRPGISYLLANKLQRENIFYREQDFYLQHKFETRLGIKAVKVLPEKKEVLLDKGENISFARLLIATGGKPFLPPMKGLDKTGVHTLTTWEDADKLREILTEKSARKIKKIVVIGAGMIGIKAAESLLAWEKEITVIELAPLVLARALDKEASLMVRKRMEELGLKVIVNNEVKEILGEERVQGVLLRDKERVDCDLVVVAIGVFPNIEPVRESGIDLQGGIVVDQYLETNIKGIFAAGDVACAQDRLWGGKRPIPIWPIAYRQGRVAGANMTGEKKRYSGGVAMNSIEFCGLPTISLGITNPPADEGYEILKKADPEKGSYKKIVLKDNSIVGAIFVNDLSRAGIITGLLREKIKVGFFKEQLLQDEFGFVSFPPEMRKEKLERVV